MLTIERGEEDSTEASVEEDLFSPLVDEDESASDLSVCTRRGGEID